MLYVSYERKAPVTAFFTHFVSVCESDSKKKKVFINIIFMCTFLQWLITQRYFFEVLLSAVVQLSFPWVITFFIKNEEKVVIRFMDFL